MLPKKNRIPRKLFPELLESSRYVNSTIFSLRFSNNQTFRDPRMAVSVSKKVSKSAVVRNRVRRRILALLNPILNKISPGAYLFITKPGIEKLTIEKLKLEIEKLLVESGAFVLKTQKS